MFYVMVTVLLSVLSLSCCSINQILSQSVGSDDEEQVSFYESVYRSSVTWEQGKPRFVVSEHLRAPTYAHFDLLRSSEIQLELELSDSQRTSLERLVNEMESRTLQLEAQWRKVAPDMLQRQNHKQQIKQWEGEVSKILLPHQVRQLGEVSNRILLREFGFEYFLQKGTGLQDLNVSASERRKIVENVRGLVETIDVDKMIDPTLNRLLSGLGESQRSKVVSESKSQGLLPDSIDIFICQTRYAVGLKESIGAGTAADYERLVNSTPGISVGADGQLHVRKRGKDPVSFSRVAEQAMRSDSIRMRFREQQFEDFNAARASYWDTVKSWQELRGEQRSEQGFVSEAQNEEFNLALKEAAELRNQQCRATLDAEQIELIRRFDARNQMTRIGLIGALLVGDLGRDIGLSDLQKEAIRDSWKRELHRIESELLELERQFIEQIAAGLEPSNRRVFESSIGRRLTYVVPNFRMITTMKKWLTRYGSVDSTSRN